MLNGLTPAKNFFPMDIESIRKFVSLLGESAIFINSIDENPITPDNYASFQRLRPALNGSFRQLDVDTEFYNELDLDRKKEILRTLGQHLETPAKGAKGLLPSHADLRNLLETVNSNNIKNDTVTPLDSEYYAGLLEFRTEIEHISDSIIAKVGEMRCPMSDGVNMADNIPGKPLENTEYSDEMKRLFRNNITELNDFIAYCSSNATDKEKVKRYKELEARGIVIKHSEYGTMSSLHRELTKIMAINCSNQAFRAYF